MAAEKQFISVFVSGALFDERMQPVVWVLYATEYTVHLRAWASAGGGAEFENDDVICSSPVKYPKFFARAFNARIKYT